MDPIKWWPARGWYCTILVSYPHLLPATQYCRCTANMILLHAWAPLPHPSSTLLQEPFHLMHGRRILRTAQSKYFGCCLCFHSSLLAVVNSLRSDLSISHGSHPLCWINTLFWSPELFMKIWNIELQSPQIFKDSNSGNHNSQPRPTTLFDDIITATSFFR